jgi:hypothetical protein
MPKKNNLNLKKLGQVFLFGALKRSQIGIREAENLSEPYLFLSLLSSL